MTEGTQTAIRRRSDGKYIQDSIGRLGENPKYVKSLDRAKMVVRIDLGHDLSEYEFISREQSA